MKIKSKILISCTSVVLLLLCSALVVYAAFTFGTNTNGSGNFVENPEGTITTTTETLSLNEPGSTVDKLFNIKNSSTNAYAYTFALEFASSNTSGIEKSILVFQDQQFIGMLNEFILKEGDLFLPVLTSKKIFLNQNEEGSTQFTFELHNSVIGNSASSFEMKFIAYANTISVKDYTIVSNFSQLKNSITAVNKGMNKTLILSANIALEAPLFIQNSCTIDFNGYDIDLSTYAITLDGNNHSYNVTIKDSKNKEHSRIYAQGWIVNSTKALLVVNDNLKQFALNNIKISLCDEEQLLSAIEKRNQNISFSTTQEYHFLGGLECYMSLLKIDGVQLTSPSISILVQHNYTSLYDFTISNQTNSIMKTISYLIYGDSTEAEIDAALSHIYFYHANEQTINFDLFLPTSIKNLGANIQWWSSNENIMTSDGKTNEIDSGEVTLIATISYNDKVISRSFILNIVKETDDMRFQYLLAAIGTIELNSVYSVDNENSYAVLPTEQTYQNSPYNCKYLKIKNISYELEPTYYYLMSSTLNSGVPFVAVSQVTFQTFGQIKIHVEFESGTILSDYININIDLGDSEELIQMVVSYIQGTLNSTSVLQNILDTRSIAADGTFTSNGDFKLITEYQQFKLEYISTDTSRYTVSTSTAGEPVTIKILLENLPERDTQQKITVRISLIDDASGNTNIHEADLTFKLPGALHYSDILFANTNIYNVVLHQVLENADVLGIENIKNLPSNLIASYMLLYDIEKTTSISLVYGNNTSVVDPVDLTLFRDIINWATGSVQKPLNSNYIDNDLSWIESDGLSTISDAEELVILTYASRYPGFKALWNDILYTNYGQIRDNLLSQNDLNSIIAAATDPIYSALISWATSSTRNETAQAVIGQSINTSMLTYEVLSLRSDGNATISNEEERVILRYMMDIGKYDTFAPLWSTSITRNDTSISSKDEVILNSLFLAESETDYNTIDPILVVIKDWVEYYQTGSTQTITLSSFFSSKGYGTDLSAFGLQSFTEYNNSVSYTNWNIISTTTYYDNFLSKEECEVILAYANFCGYDTTNVFTSENISPASTNYTEKLSQGGGTFGGTSYYRITTSAWSTIFQSVKNSKTPTDPAYSTDYHSILTWMTGNSHVRILDLGLTTKSNEEFNILISDGTSAITFEEYTALIQYLSDPNVNASTSYNQVAASTILNNVFNFSFTNNELTQTEKNSLLSIFGNVASALEDILKNASSFGEAFQTENFDGLSTISYQEYLYLISLANSFENSNEYISQLNKALWFRPDMENYLKDLSNVNNFLSGNNSTDLELIESAIQPVIDKNYFEITTSNLDHSLPFIHFFSNLRSLTASGGVTGNNVSHTLFSSQAADEFFNSVTSYCKELVSLDLRWSGITTLDYISNLQNLLHLDLYGNQELTSLEALLDLRTSQLEFLDISSTNINLTLEKGIFEFLHLNSKSENKIFIWDDNEMSVLYKSTLTANQKLALEACFSLKYLSLITTQYTQLPSKIYLANNVSATIEWGYSTSGIQFAENATIVFIRDASGIIKRIQAVSSGYILLTATITINGESYTRYFITEVKIEF